MRHRTWIIIGVSCALFWASVEVFAQRGGGRGGGGRGGGGRVGGGAVGGGGRVGGGGISAPSINRTPSFSPPAAASRPAQLPSGPSIGSRPAQLPATGARPGIGDRPPISTPPSRPDIGSRPSIGSKPSQLPATGARPGVGDRPGISTLPSTRPDIGGRPGVGSGTGVSTLLPAVGAGAIGAGIANRAGDRQATLPGLGVQRPGVSQLPADRTPQQRQQALHDRLAGEGRPGQQPARDWNQVRQDWQQHRDDVRNDWQTYRDQARDDWQNWFDDHYWWHGGWYWGHAPGYWARWDYLWDNHPVAAAAGLTWWGVNSLGYQFGYGDYYNPYYAETMPVYYTEPVITQPVEAAAPATGLPPGVSQESINKFDEARAAFLEGKYDAALKLTDEALVKMPRDAVLHEFRSLVLFALKRYAESSATIHAVLAVGPGWDWKTLSSLYPNADTYTAQLRTLEAARDKDPKADDVRFLLGYHYLTVGYPDNALAQFRRALELQPKDEVAASLVATLSPRDAKPAQAPAETAAKPVATDNVIGTWTAASSGSAKYAMGLQKDGTFTWSFTRGSRKQEVKGVYTLEGNVLGMEPDGGGVLLAELTARGPDTLHFKMIGGATDDPGLEFRRGSSK
jgi:tetratricopeptide (TPR) repeat protein